MHENIKQMIVSEADVARQIVATIDRCVGNLLDEIESLTLGLPEEEYRSIRRAFGHFMGGEAFDIVRRLQQQHPLLIEEEEQMIEEENKK